MNPTLRYGLSAGLFSVLYLLLVYLYDTKLLMQGWEAAIWLILLLFMLLAAKQARNPKSEPRYSTAELLRADTPELSAFAPMPILLKLLFRVFVLGYSLKFLFIYLLFHYVDPSLIEMAKDTEVKAFVANRPDNLTDAVFDEQLQAFIKGGSFGPQLEFMALFIVFILGFLISALIALFFRRPKPEYLEES